MPSTSKRVIAPSALLPLVILGSACTAGEGTDLSPSPAAAGETTVTESVTRSDLDASDGYVPDGESLSPFDMDQPAVAELDGKLRTAVRDAADAARSDGIELRITTAWRSEQFQRVLLDEAIAENGSRDEALKRVATPDSSHHVTGEAVDVGPTAAADWLSRNGAKYGLCQTYANELWHYELTVKPGERCPAPLPDASAQRD